MSSTESDERYEVVVKRDMKGVLHMVRGGHTFARGGPGTFGGRNWRDHHHRFSNDVFFFGDFPGWWDWGYPYGYYGYDYYPYDYYGYGGYGYDNGSSIAQMQRQLAQAGYYQGAIDGIMGPATRRANSAYERDQ